MSGLLEHYHFRDDEYDADRWHREYGAAEHDRHATLRYNDVANAGPPARPLDFPSPKVFRGKRVNLRARDHKSGTIHNLKSVLLQSRNRSRYNSNESGSDTAYLMTKKISKTVYGCVNLCIVLKRINKSSNGIHSENALPQLERRQDDDNYVPSVEWESTDHQVAIKISEWKRVHALRGKHFEDPVKEIAAMQLLGNYHKHFAGTLEVLQDDKCLYTVMPYLGGGDIYGRLVRFMGYRSIRSENGKGTTGFDEGSARIWFRQLLKAINLFQKKGVCHRDICLENILLDNDDNLCLIDPGTSLRIPYTDSETGGVGDVSAGTSRRLMLYPGQGGKLLYAAPEIISKEPEIDAFATDLWSVGIVLFVMTVGLAPFRWAHPSDKRYASISSGGLKQVVKELKISVSPEVCDLLQGFFWADPQKRLTLAEIVQHPWVQEKELISRSTTLPHKPSVSQSFTSRGYSFGSLNLSKKIRGKKKTSNNSCGIVRAKQNAESHSTHAEYDRHHFKLNNDATWG